jgi:hypothetical protein
LKTKYGSIEQLNQVWQRSFPSFEQIEIPKRPCDIESLARSKFVEIGWTPEAWLDFDEFMHAEYSFAYLDSRLGIIRDQLRVEHEKKLTFLKLPPEAMDWGSPIEANAARFAASDNLWISSVSISTQFSSVISTVRIRPVCELLCRNLSETH